MRGDERYQVEFAGTDAEPTGRIREVIEWVDARKAEPAFSNEVGVRRARAAGILPSDDELLRVLARLIAYSQGARADSVTRLLEGSAWEQAFVGFRVPKVARLDREALLAAYWPQFGAIRFRGKITAIIECAAALERLDRQGDSLHRAIEAARVPGDLTDLAAVDRFWDAFRGLQVLMKAAGMPFFRSTTSLLHLLLELGFPCAKPDRVVMDVAVRVGLVEARTGQRNIVGAVRGLQVFGLGERIPPSVLDLYFLTFGGQTSTLGLLRDEYRGQTGERPF